MCMWQSRILLQRLWCDCSRLTLRRWVPQWNLIWGLLLLSHGNGIQSKRRINSWRVCIVAQRSMVIVRTVLVWRCRLIGMGGTCVWLAYGVVCLLRVGIMLPRWGCRNIWHKTRMVLSKMRLVPRRSAILLIGGGRKEVVEGWVVVNVLALKRVVIMGHVTGGHGERKCQALRLAIRHVIGWMRGAATDSVYPANGDYATTQSALGTNRLAQSHKGGKWVRNGRCCEVKTRNTSDLRRSVEVLGALLKSGCEGCRSRGPGARKMKARVPTPTAMSAMLCDPRPRNRVFGLNRGDT